MAKAATPRRSSLDESPLVDMVEDITGTDATPSRAFREDDIAKIMKEREVPRAVAEIMVDKGYSKGTAFRIFNDEFKRKAAKRERDAGVNGA